MGRKEHFEMLLYKKVGKICLYVVDTPNEYDENFRAGNNEVTSFFLPVLPGVSNPSFPQGPSRAY